MNDKIIILPYVAFFSAIYAVSLILLLMITTFLNINAQTSAVALVIATFAAAGKFVRDHERVPDLNEYLRLSLASLCVSTFISLILVIVFLVLTGAIKPLIEALTQMNSWLIIAIFVGAFSLHYIQLYFFYWLGAKIQFRTLNNNKLKKGKISATELLSNKENHSFKSANIPSIWKVIISFFIPGLGSILIRGWRARGVVFILLIITVPVSFFFFGPYWGEVLFAGTKYKETGGWLFLAVCVIVPFFSLLLAYYDRKKIIKKDI